MEDIAPGLLERVREKFEADARADARVKAFLRKVEKGTATQDDCGAYADRLGELLTRAMADVVTPEALPNGILYQNIAEKLLTPTLRDVYERVNENAARVQKKEDEARHIGMNAAKPAFPEARVRDLTYVIGRPDNAQEQALSFLREPVRTISRSFHDDFIEENARQRWYAGMDPIVSREASAGCCEWCAALAGNWDYGDAEHLGVFRRHQFCRCSVTYSCDGRAQDVWSKKYYEADPETIKERAEYGRELIRADAEKNGVANGGERGIISGEIVLHTRADPMAEVLGRAEESHPEETQALFEHIRHLGAEIIREDHEKLGYSPALVPGSPGQVFFSHGASYSALLHEVKHLDDDYSSGWAGFRAMMDPQVQIKREKDAYEIEIELARSMNREDMVRRLEALRDAEIERILNT